MQSFLTVEEKVVISSPIHLVWHAWTISERVSEWFAPHAVIQPEIGGLYELYFIPGNEDQMNTKGCKITKFDVEKELHFTWKGPDPFSSIMNLEEQLTVVKVFFQSINDKTTSVKVKHEGFFNQKEWVEAIEWHKSAWADVLSSLKSALEQGEGNLCCQPV